MATPMETDKQARDQQQAKGTSATGYELPWVRAAHDQ